MHHYGTAGGAIIATASALTGQELTAWAAAVVAVVSLLWGLWRDQRRRDLDQELHAEQAKAIVKANVEAIEKGNPPPFPQFITAPEPEK